jgi:hypothetical protein
MEWNDLPSLIKSPTFSEVMMAPIGTPLANGLAMVKMSGTILSKCW